MLRCSICDIRLGLRELIRRRARFCSECFDYERLARWAAENPDQADYDEMSHQAYECASFGDWDGADVLYIRMRAAKSRMAGNAEGALLDERMADAKENALRRYHKERRARSPQLDADMIVESAIRRPRPRPDA